MSAPSRFHRTKSWMVWKMAMSETTFLSAICWLILRLRPLLKPPVKETVKPG